MKFLHTMIRVSNIKKSLDFYQNILSLKIKRTLELKNAKLYYLTDNEGKVEIELTYNNEPVESYNMGSGFGHFAFGIVNIDDFTKILEKNNLSYDREPFEVMPGLKIAFIKDPDGYAIEIIESKKN